MAQCVRPVLMYKSARLNPDTGKRQLTFNPREALGTDMTVEVPCRQCIGCRLNKKAEWAVRCYHEASQHAQNSFITLTYDDNHLPPHLEQPVLSKFFRKLRDSGNKLRYFACGEYGGLTRRPHYHAIIFGMDFLGGAEKMGEDSYYSPVLTAAWGKGHCQVGNFTMGAACYVAGYVAKKMDTPEDDSFTVMSRRPGIGHNWLDKYYDDIARTEHVVIEGAKYPIPARYLAWKDIEFSELIDKRKDFINNLTRSEKQQRKEALPHLEVNYLARSKPREQSKL